MANRYYINNKEFQDLLVRFYNNRDNKQLNNEVAEKLVCLANRLADSVKFRSYPYDLREELIQASIVKMWIKIDDYNYKKYENPFAWFTSVAYNTFRLILKKNKRNINETVDINLIEMNTHSYLLDGKFRDKINYHESKHKSEILEK